jgi:hypothetical protein
MKNSKRVPTPVTEGRQPFVVDQFKYPQKNEQLWDKKRLDVHAGNEIESESSVSLFHSSVLISQSTMNTCTLLYYTVDAFSALTLSALISVIKKTTRMGAMENEVLYTYESLLSLADCITPVFTQFGMLCICVEKRWGRFEQAKGESQN